MDRQQCQQAEGEFSLIDGKLVTERDLDIPKMGEEAQAILMFLSTETESTL